VLAGGVLVLGVLDGDAHLLQGEHGRVRRSLETSLAVSSK